MVTVSSALRLLATYAARRVGSTRGRKIAYLPVFLDASHTLLERVDALIASGAFRAP